MFYNPFKKYDYSVHLYQELKSIFKNAHDDKYLTQRKPRPGEPGYDIEPYFNYIYSFCPNTYDIRYIDDVFGMIKYFEEANIFTEFVLLYDENGYFTWQENNPILSVHFLTKSIYGSDGGGKCIRIDFDYANDNLLNAKEVRDVYLITRDDDKKEIVIDTHDGTNYQIIVTNGPKLKKRVFMDQNTIITYYRSFIESVCIKTGGNIYTYDAINDNDIDLIDLANSILKQSNALKRVVQIVSKDLSLRYYKLKHYTNFN